MSGGYFDYQKYVLRDIARSIARTLQPKPVKETACNKRDTAKTEEAHRVVVDYFRGLSDVDRLKEENVFIYIQYAESPSDELTRFLVEHRDAFPEEVQEELAERIAELYEQCIVGWFAGYEPFDAKAYGQAKQDIDLLGLNADGHYDVLYRFIDSVFTIMLLKN